MAAIKRPRPHDDEALARFRREIEVQSELDHPHVMPILEYSIERQWLAMPLAVHSLTQRVEREGTIDGYQLPAMVRQWASALIYSHQRGYVHRDVTPNNLLELDEPGERRWVVADWGLVYRAPVEEAPG